MSLIKNDYPILEYDTDSKAIIMPGHSTDFHFPERAVMLFMETEVENYAVENDARSSVNSTRSQKYLMFIKRFITVLNLPFVRLL